MTGAHRQGRMLCDVVEGQWFHHPPFVFPPTEFENQILTFEIRDRGSPRTSCRLRSHDNHTQASDMVGAAVRGEIAVRMERHAPRVRPPPLRKQIPS
jgi:hypothetical protein